MKGFSGPRNTANPPEPVQRPLDLQTRGRSASCGTSQNFESRLSAYAMAAGAAGVGLLAAALPAEAEVVFTPAHTIFTTGTLFIDLNNDGLKDFALTIYNWSTSDRRLVVSGLNAQNGALGYSSGPSYPPFALKSGSPIPPTRSGGFWQREAPAANVGVSIFGTAITGPFPNVGARYLGLQFVINGEIHYGWAAIKVKGRATTAHSAEIQVTLLGYAYETVANESILAGQRSGAGDVKMSDPIPGPGSLGVLAHGWRTSEPTDQSGTETPPRP
jgi:hypothetical protein